MQDNIPLDISFGEGVIPEDPIIFNKTPEQDFRRLHKLPGISIPTVGMIRAVADKLWD